MWPCAKSSRNSSAVLGQVIRSYEGKLTQKRNKQPESQGSEAGRGF